MQSFMFAHVLQSFMCEFHRLYSNQRDLLDVGSLILLSIGETSLAADIFLNNWKIKHIASLEMKHHQNWRRKGATSFQNLERMMMIHDDSTNVCKLCKMLYAAQIVASILIKYNI